MLNRYEESPVGPQPDTLERCHQFVTGPDGLGDGGNLVAGARSGRHR
jgi:hypothetical protein